MPGYPDVQRRVPPLHVITDDRVLGRPEFLEHARAVLAAGGSHMALHLRGHELPAVRLYSLAIALASPARSAGAMLLVNDRVDVALAAGCAGVQLRVRSMTPNDARELLGPSRLIGSSVHSVLEAEHAGRSGADFLLAGSVYSTDSHPGEAPAGRGLLEQLADFPLPVIAIGGVTPARGAELRAAGVAGVAAIGGVWGSPSPQRAVGQYLQAMKAA